MTRNLVDEQAARVERALKKAGVAARAHPDASGGLVRIWTGGRERYSACVFELVRSKGFLPTLVDAIATEERVRRASPPKPEPEPAT